MDFLNNLINNIRNYFAPQQTQVPVNAVQPGQGPIAPVQQTIDYNQAIAGQPIQQIQLPEIQLPQIQTGPIAPTQQTIDYNQAIAGQPITPLPTIDFNAVASQPITQAQPFQLGTTEQYSAPIVQEQPTLQQLIQQQQVPQGQTIGAPINVSTPINIGQGSIAGTPQQRNKDLEGNLVLQQQKEVFVQQQVVEGEKQRIADEQVKTEKRAQLDGLIEKYGEQEAFKIVEQQNKENEDNFTKDILKRRDEEYAKGNILGGIQLGLAGFGKGLSDAVGGKTASQRAYEQTFSDFYGKEAPSLNLQAKTIEEIQRGQQVKDGYKGTIAPIIESRNVYAADMAYRVKQGTISTEEAKIQTDSINTITDGMVKRTAEFHEKLYANGLDEEKTMADFGIGKKFLTYAAYIKQDMPETNIERASGEFRNLTAGAIGGGGSLKYNDNISPEDALKWQIAHKRLGDPYVSRTYAGTVVSSLLTQFSLATFAGVKGALYDTNNIFGNVTGVRPLEVGGVVDLLGGSQLQQADAGETRAIGKGATQTAITMFGDWFPELAASIGVEIATTKGVGALGKMKYLVSPTTMAGRNYNRMVNVVNSLDVFVGSQLQNAVIESASAPLGDSTPMSYALNPFFDVIGGAALKKFTYKPLSLDLNQLVDGNWTQTFIRATAIDNLNQKAGQKAGAWTETAIKGEMDGIKNVTQKQVDDYRSTVEASARGLVQLQKENPTLFNKVFKQKMGEQLMLDMASKTDGSVASKIQLTGLLNDIANADIGTAEMVGRALGTGGIIHAMDGTSFNPLNLDAGTYGLFKQGVRDVPQEVINKFGNNFNVTGKIDATLLNEYAVDKGIDPADMIDNSGRLTIEGVRKLGIKLDGDILAKFAKGDVELLVKSVSEKAGVSVVEGARAVNRIHDIIGSIVC